MVNSWGNSSIMKATDLVEKMVKTQFLLMKAGWVRPFSTFHDQVWTFDLAREPHTAPSVPLAFLWKIFFLCYFSEKYNETVRAPKNWMSNEKKDMIPPGLEPGTFRVLGERDNHYTTESLSTACGCQNTNKFKVTISWIGWISWISKLNF